MPNSTSRRWRPIPLRGEMGQRYLFAGSRQGIGNEGGSEDEQDPEDPPNKKRILSPTHWEIGHWR